MLQRRARPRALLYSSAVLLPCHHLLYSAARPRALLQCSTPPCASAVQHAPVRFYSAARPRALLQCSTPPCASTVQRAPVRFYSSATRPRYITKWPIWAQFCLNYHFVTTVYLRLKKRYFIDFSTKNLKNWLKTKGHKWSFKDFLAQDVPTGPI